MGLSVSLFLCPCTYIENYTLDLSDIFTQGGFLASSSVFLKDDSDSGPTSNLQYFFPFFPNYFTQKPRRLCTKDKEGV